MLDEVDGRALARTGSQVDGKLGRQLMPVDENVEQGAGDEGDHLLGDVRRNEVALDQSGLNDFVTPKALDRVVEGLVGPFSAAVRRQGPHGFDGAMLGDDFGQRDRHGLAAGDGGLLCSGDGQHELDEVFFGEHRRVLKHRNGDRLDIIRELEGDLTRQDGRRSERDGERAADEIGCIFRQDGDDLFGESLFPVRQNVKRDAAAEPVGNRSALLGCLAAHQAQDVVFGQLWPDALDRHGRGLS